ncbi:tetraacyldisaccharide 4'-kinase [Pontibacter aydingkolensis]|uniref:Tetraacyldisaccharide 4'-kinase n=1 Tax=Pontibacter aydingkolensis TaxID=1911536 RepID=A0ABS7CTI3_9BACT|nr:tetraacyldisaccharide 4'-kinase [Pontibacter aydingkolensis]MBW7467171.1 tetraacyldisaccharide 4'-kinase [Pontibacter aydingkolensis]
MAKYLKLLLWPFSLLYGAVTGCRNFLYKQGILKSTGFDFPVIAVGNLTVGGTGKTPHVEYLIRLLKEYKLATLSRGYKRKSKGFILADTASTAVELGDEPYQYHRDFPEVAVAVSEKRVEGVQKLKQLVPDVEVVILDDAMQHRAIKPSLMIMLTDYGRPFFRDFILPAGLLRESRQGAQRADLVVVSKCPPDLSASEMVTYTSQIRKYTSAGTPVYFSAFKYGTPVSIGNTRTIAENILPLTGIANPAPLQEYLQQQGYNIVKAYTFPDHHTYTLKDIVEVKREFEKYKDQNISIITTSKDAVKLTDGRLARLTKELPIFYLPIEVSFLKDAAIFDLAVAEHLKCMPAIDKI